MFAVNDKRTYGDYVGHHRLVMEKGLPHQGTVSLGRTGGTVYDLVASRAVPTQSQAGLRWSVALGPGEGRVYMVTPRPLARVVTSVTRRQASDRKATVQVSIVDAAGKALPAMIPLRVDIVDPQGNLAEFSGHYGVANGALSVRLDLAINDAPGMWKVRVRELASGKTAETSFEYKP